MPGCAYLARAEGFRPVANDPGRPPAMNGSRRTEGSGRPAPRPLLSAVLLLLVAAAVVALDQWSKSWALQDLSDVSRRHVIGPMYLALTFNQGAAFSLGAGASPIIEAVAIALVVAVIAMSRRAARGGANLAVIIGLGLLLGGALSNLGDRLFRHHHGAVVDFIQLVSWWPTFNVADASITVGAVTLVIALVFFPPSQRSAATAPSGPVEQPTGRPSGSSHLAVSAARPGGQQSFGRWA
jgi:signal peptidase II